MGARRTRVRRTPFLAEPPGAIERLARLAGSTNFKIPQPRGSSQALTAHDLGHALGCVPDKMGAWVAYAMACRTMTVAPQILPSAVRRIVARMKKRMHVRREVSAANQYRVRKASYDALKDLVFPERAEPLWKVAEANRMTPRAYWQFYRMCAAVLEAAAQSAAARAIEVLTGRAQPRLTKAERAKRTLAMLRKMRQERCVVWRAPELARVSRSAGSGTE